MTELKRAVLRLGLALIALTVSTTAAHAEKEGATCWWYGTACSWNGGSYTGCPQTWEGTWLLKTVAQTQCSGQN